MPPETSPLILNTWEWREVSIRFFVEITLRRGRPVEKKQALYREIAERMAATGLVRREDVLIVLHENETADWSFGNGVAQYVEAENKDAEQARR